MAQDFLPLIYSAPAFIQRAIPRREWLVEPVLPHPGLGMLYAWRGSGKTFCALSLAIAIASGTAWMGYKVPAGRGVLYCDAEMPLGDLRARLEAMTLDGAPPNLYILASEDLAIAQRSINLAKPEDRDNLTHTIAELPVDLVILDNWTGFVRGVDENDNSAMDPIKEWLIFLRHGNKSVMIVHHAGKEGAQRGGSAREDVLDYSLRLSEVAGSSKMFRAEWDKMRTGRPDPSDFYMRLENGPGDRLSLVRLEQREAQGAKADRPTQRLLEALRVNGAQTVDQLVESTGLDAVQISACLINLAGRGKIKGFGQGPYYAT